MDIEQRAALEEQRDFLLRSLEDLEREHAAGDVDEHDYRRCGTTTRRAAAAVLRALAAGQRSGGSSRPTAVAAPALRSQ